VKKLSMVPRSGRFSALSKVLACTLLLSISGAKAQGTSDRVQLQAPLQTQTPLHGGVNLDETLPPVPPQFQVGTQISNAQLAPQTPDNMWFPIPNWLAGKWHSETKLIDYIQDCKSGASQSPHAVVKEVDSATHGHQRDRTGRIWEFIQVPQMRKIGLAHGNAYVRAVRKDVIVSDPAEVTLKILSNQITVNDTDQQIVASNQVQQIGTYTPLEDGLVNLSASLRNFDNDGAPIQMQKQSLTMKRIAPYEDVDTLDGLNLKELFAEYLTKTGHPELVPTAK
jgi:hypothetical protein